MDPNTEAAAPRRLERDDGLVARSVVAADLPAIVGVLQSTFDEWPPVPIDRSALEYLEWKLTSRDFDLSAHTVVECEGAIVACKLRWFGRALLCGEPQITDVGADLAVLPTFQGRGISRLMNDFEEQTNRPHGTVSFERPSQQPSVLHMEGESRTFSLRTWVRPLGAASFARSQLRAGGPLLLLRAGVASATARLRTSRRHPVATEVFEQFDARADALWDASSDRFDIARVRDAAALNWRYADPRSGRRLMVGAFQSDALRAYAVFRPVGSALHLLDLLAHPDHGDAARAVLDRGAALGRAAGHTAIIAWLPPDHADDPIYADAGFIAGAEFPVDYKVPRGVSAPAVAEQLYRPDLRRHATMGDFDFA